MQVSSTSNAYASIQAMSAQHTQQKQGAAPAAKEAPAKDSATIQSQPQAKAVDPSIKIGQNIDVKA